MPSKFYCDILLVVLLFLCKYSMVFGQYQQNPCPSLFQYRYDEANILYGYIQVDSIQDDTIEIEVELVVGNKVSGFQGSVELAYSKERAVQDLQSGKPLIYKVTFPMWSYQPPRITKIILQNREICTGPSINDALIITTIRLKHMLKITSDNSFLKPLNYQNQDYSNLVVRQDPTQQMVFKNPYSFKPQPPQNPSNIYPQNPFFPNLTMLQTPNNNPPRSEFYKPPTNLQFKPPMNQQFKPQNHVTSVTQRTFPIINSEPSGTGSHLNQDICGVAVSTNSLIVNGNHVSKGAYPWLVAIYEVEAEVVSAKYICGGSLVSHKHVITAAHCMMNKQFLRHSPSDIILKLGKSKINNWIQEEGEMTVSPRFISIHEDYQVKTAIGDIAVITMNQEVRFTSSIRPICLWSGSDDLNRIVGRNGVVAGWGNDETGKLSQEPRQTSIPIVSQETCLRSSYDFNGVTSDKTFCAGLQDGNGPCNGDSGSGFIIQQNGRWALRGVVSLSLGTSSRKCDLNYYVVFADAGKYRQWLLSIIK